MRLKLPCLWEKSHKRDFFDVLPDVLMSFCVAGVALCDIPACFTTHQKSFCVAGAILLLHVHTMRSIFRGRRSTLDTSDVILRGRRSTLDVSFCVFYANCIVSAARSGDKVQIPSKNVDFDAAKCESCRAYGKSRKNVSFSTCHQMCSCRFAWHAWRFVTFHVCEVQDCREAEVAVPMGKVVQTCLFRRVTRCAHVVLRGRRCTFLHCMCV